MGARAIDCPEKGGLGFLPLADAHSWQALGILTERTEKVGGPKPDSCYAIRLSSMDSDSEEEVAAGAATAGATAGWKTLESSEFQSLLYEGDPITLSQGDAAWIPVIVPSPMAPNVGQTLQCAFPCTDSPVELVPGMWGDADERGVVCVVAHEV